MLIPTHTHRLSLSSVCIFKDDGYDRLEIAMHLAGGEKTHRRIDAGEAGSWGGDLSWELDGACLWYIYPPFLARHKQGLYRTTHAPQDPHPSILLSRQRQLVRVHPKSDRRTQSPQSPSLHLVDSASFLWTCRVHESMGTYKRRSQRAS